MAKRCTPWEEVRARYETEDCTYRQLAEEYGVSIYGVHQSGDDASAQRR